MPVVICFHIDICELTIAAQIKPRFFTFRDPWDSLLGPSLFTLDINHIHNLPVKNAEIIYYADNTITVFHGNIWDETLSSAELEMAKISQWSQNNLLNLSTTNTQYLCFDKTKTLLTKTEMPIITNLLKIPISF